MEGCQKVSRSKLTWQARTDRSVRLEEACLALIRYIVLSSGEEIRKHHNSKRGNKLFDEEVEIHSVKVRYTTLKYRS